MSNELIAAPSRPLTVAALDVGSNAIRMLIAQINPDGRAQRLENLQRAVPLGQDCFPMGHIKPETINLSIEVLRSFQTIMAPYHVDHLRAVATSAVREAANQELFLERIYLATGIALEVITGPEEDRLLYSAVCDAFGVKLLPPGEVSMIVELGSGSAVFSMFHQDQVVYSGTYPLGTIRLSNAVRPAHRSASETVDLLRRFIDPFLDTLQHSAPLKDVLNFIGVGGDLRFAAERLDKTTDRTARVKVIGREAFLRFAGQISKLSPEELSRKYSLPFEDSETLVPALITYAELLQRTPAQEIHVPNASMRDGLILDIIAEKTGQGIEELESKIFSSVESLGRRYQYDEGHARRVADLACELFDQLKAEHGLGASERRLLRVAGLLHDVGVFISNRSHHKHSEYIIQAADIFGMRAGDKNLAAIIARYHRRSGPKPTHPGFTSLTRQERATVSKLAAILRVADALDRSHSGKIRAPIVVLRPNEAILRLDTREDLTLERLAMRGKGEMFEEVYGRKIILENVRL